MAVFQAQTKFGYSEGTKLIFTLDHNFAGKEHNIGKFRISVTDRRPPILLQGAMPENIVKLLNIAPEKRSPQEKDGPGQLLPRHRPGTGPPATLRRRGGAADQPAGARRPGSGVGADQQPGVPVQQVGCNSRRAEPRKRPECVTNRFLANSTRHV